MATSVSANGQFGDTSPAMNFASVTPSDSVGLTYFSRALYVGTTGDVVVVSPSGSAVTFVGVPAGAILPVKAVRVNATGTTAGGIVALW